MDELVAIVTQDDENVENAERDGRHREEVTGSDIGNVVVQKRSPIRPEPRQQDPEDAVTGPQLRTFGGVLENGQLLP